MPKSSFERSPEVAARLAEAREVLTIPRRCKQGHNLSDKNLYVRPDLSMWQCRLCENERRAANKSGQKAPARPRAQSKPKARPKQYAKPGTKRPLKGPDSARAMIIDILSEHGGEIADPSSGRSTAMLHEAMLDRGYEGLQAAVSGLLRAMENDGEVHRTMNGKRTYQITLIGDETPNTSDHLRTLDMKMPEGQLDSGQSLDDAEAVSDEGDTLGLLLEGIDFISRLALELRQPSGVSYAEHTSQINQLHESYRGKIRGLEDEVRTQTKLTERHEQLIAEYQNLQVKHLELQETSDQLVAEAATVQAGLLDQIEELKKKSPGGDPNLSALKAAAAAKFSKRLHR
jgi:hypothetical protein